LRILLHYAENRELRLASISLLAITFRQVFPGIGAFMSRIAHVALRSLTMAATAVS
jgi:hypothetical protein